MNKELNEILKTMSIYEKQELIRDLTEEINCNYSQMLSHLKNIDGHVFGMIHNSESNNLNELTMIQLDRIKNLSKQSKNYD